MRISDWSSDVCSSDLLSAATRSTSPSPLAGKARRPSGSSTWPATTRTRSIEMTRNAKACAITIFEGPDGAGKSTLAQEYAQLTNARYVHHGPYKQVGDGPGRMSVESKSGRAEGRER